MKSKILSVLVAVGLGLFMIGCDMFGGAFVPSLEGTIGNVTVDGVLKFRTVFTIVNLEQIERTPLDPGLTHVTFYHAKGTHSTIPSTGVSEKDFVPCAASGRWFEDHEIGERTGKYTYWLVMYNSDGSNTTQPSNFVVLDFGQ